MKVWVLLRSYWDCDDDFVGVYASEGAAKLAIDLRENLTVRGLRRKRERKIEPDEFGWYCGCYHIHEEEVIG